MLCLSATLLSGYKLITTNTKMKKSDRNNSMKKLKNKKMIVFVKQNTMAKERKYQCGSFNTNWPCCTHSPIVRVPRKDRSPSQRTYYWSLCGDDSVTLTQGVLKNLNTLSCTQHTIMGKRSDIFLMLFTAHMPTMQNICMTVNRWTRLVSTCRRYMWSGWCFCGISKISMRSANWKKTKKI